MVQASGTLRGAASGTRHKHAQKCKSAEIVVEEAPDEDKHQHQCPSHARTHARTHTQTHTRTHTYIYTLRTTAPVPVARTHTRTHTHTHIHTAHNSTSARRTQAHTYTHTHTLRTTAPVPVAVPFPYPPQSQSFLKKVENVYKDQHSFYCGGTLQHQLLALPLSLSLPPSLIPSLPFSLPPCLPPPPTPPDTHSKRTLQTRDIKILSKTINRHQAVVQTPHPVWSTHMNHEYNLHLHTHTQNTHTHTCLEHAHEPSGAAPTPPTCTTSPYPSSIASQAAAETRLRLPPRLQALPTPAGEEASVHQ